ncbi:MAG: LysM peptidoglycan-binding domain-containing protein [Firmicutes bacterium]|nr:LysM peptidoglycan-binding domain-containing protein [Bacillota bacterium]
MIKYFSRGLKVFVSIILIFNFIPIQSNASQDYVFPKVISSSISEKIIAYKGIKNPESTNIKFKTNKPVVAHLKISSPNESISIRLNKWLDKKTEYEFSFIPINYDKAVYDEFELLPPGVYGVSFSIVDEEYNKSMGSLGSIKIVKESQKKPKMKIKYIEDTYKFIQGPIYHDSNEQANTIVHNVTAGETIWKISKRYNVPIEDIVEEIA